MRKENEAKNEAIVHNTYIEPLKLQLLNMNIVGNSIQRIGSRALSSLIRQFEGDSDDDMEQESMPVNGERNTLEAERDASSEEEEEEEDGGESTNFDKARANEVADKMLNPKTKQDYTRRIKSYGKWLNEHSRYRKFITEEGEVVQPLNAEAIEEYLGFLSQPDNEDRVIAVSTMGLHISALKWYNRMHEDNNSGKLDKVFKKFYSGFKRDVAQRKLSGKMKIKEGKNPATFLEYKQIARIALFAANMFPVAHIFVVLCWNLMCRCNSVATLMYAHISRGEDCIIFTLPKQKNDPEGDKGFPKHVYSNPSNPTICPVLAIALWVFTRSFNRSDYDAESSNRLFNDNAQKQFSSWLNDRMKEIATVSVWALEIGTSLD
jgi:hypothetical protein